MPNMNYEMLQLESCDIFFTRSFTIFGRLIRLDESAWDDSIAVINHTGIVVEPGPLVIADAVEALFHVKRHSIYSRYHGRQDKVAIFRPIGLNDDQKILISNKALTYVGRDYGYLKIFGHALDYFTGGHYIFRRLFNSDNYPICSWVVAHAYKAANLLFGCDPGMANPDDIWDFCIENPDKYKQILDLSNI